MQVSVSRSADRSAQNNALKSFASADGRRIGFLYAMPCLAVGSFGVSVSHSVPELLFWRAVQAAGSSAGMSTGMAMIGDIYKLEERGTAMGITFSVRFPRSFHAARAVGNGALPVGSSDRTSGCPVSRRDRHRVRFRDRQIHMMIWRLLTERSFIRYASWRLMQTGVGVAALLTYLLMRIGLPETSHPGTRGIDKEFGGKFRWVWLNPFKCLWYMRSPNLFALVSQFCK